MNDIVRPARVEDAEAIGWVSVTAWRETYAGIMPDDYLAALSTQQREEALRGIREATEQAVGDVLGKPAADAYIKKGSWIRSLSQQRTRPNAEE